VQAQRRPNESKMRECLREVAKLPLRRRIVFFRQQANIVAQREQTLEQGACFGIPMLQLVIWCAIMMLPMDMSLHPG
jgi:hypothetical protein